MDIDFNTKCFRFEFINYEKGIFDKTIDCTYIIHLENNGRLEHIHTQLEEFKPTKKICIVFNKGFKKCNKKIIDQQSYQDLTDAFLQCFKNASQNGFKNILILEDDFIFSKEIKKDEHIKNINTFLISKKDEEFVYSLGCIPILITPTTLTSTSFFSTYHSIKSLTMHSVIYSEKCIQNASTTLKTEYKHWDVIIEKSIKHRYLYHKPLCYQTFPETENKKSWNEKDNFMIISSIKDTIINALNLNKHPEPGFTILYSISKIIFIIFFLMVLLCVIYFIYFIYFLYQINQKLRLKKLIKNKTKV
jgi:hypothetical protein